MKIIKPSYEIQTVFDRGIILRHLEAAGRTCYKSENEITEESASKFVRGIVKRGHESVIEHWSVTVKFICDRGVTHELVRHRLASYSQESTRYCNYAKKGDGQLTFILPCWFKEIKEGNYVISDMFSYMLWSSSEGSSERCAEKDWICTILRSGESYLRLIKNGWTPQQARSVLPNSLKTEIVTTANLREWRHILKLRTSSKAHPQIREIMLPLLKRFQEELPEIYEGV